MELMAARLGDLTSHGGVINNGASSVLIGGQPAARIGDMHSCPVVVPGMGPHQGGPVNSGSTTVLIEGCGAARISDSAVCSLGPVDFIVSGCETVLIGGFVAQGGASDTSDEADNGERPFCELCEDEEPDGSDAD